MHCKHTHKHTHRVFAKILEVASVEVIYKAIIMFVFNILLCDFVYIKIKLGPLTDY